jgi:hypothetical protein
MALLVQRPNHDTTDPARSSPVRHWNVAAARSVSPDSVRNNYAYLQYHLMEFVTEHLIDLARSFNGDLQQVLVLAMVGQVFLNRGEPVWPETGRAPRGISASRISDVTAIPRQTVRRKLEALRARGWIEQCPDQTWRIAIRDGRSSAANDLADIDARGLHRGLRLVSAFMQRM